MTEQQQSEDRPLSSDKSNTVPINSLPKRMVQDFTRVYASVINSMASPYDVSLTFGQPIIGTAEESYIQQTVSVTLSWQAAKSLTRLLDRLIADYEQEWGEIRIPPPDQPPSE